MSFENDIWCFFKLNNKLLRRYNYTMKDLLLNRGVKTFFPNILQTFLLLGAVWQNVLNICKLKMAAHPGVSGSDVLKATASDVVSVQVMKPTSSCCVYIKEKLLRFLCKF